MSKTKASESKSKPQKEDSEPVLTVFEDHEVPYAVLNNALTRLVTILEKPLVGKESFTAVKLKKDHVEFLMKETMLSKVEVECLLTRNSGDISAAIKMYLESPLGKSFKF